MRRIIFTDNREKGKCELFNKRLVAKLLWCGRKGENETKQNPPRGHSQELIIIFLS